VIVVSNASPLISLAKAEHLFILEKLFRVVHITNEVYSETTTAGRGGAELIAASDWLRTGSLRNLAQLATWEREYRLGIGELSTILLAQELTADVAIIDERKARVLARNFGIAVVGTIGLLEESLRRNIISDLRTAYRKLLATGTYIDQRLLNSSLRTFGLPAL
jgi:predicted nucleic acid-binding protein